MLYYTVVRTKKDGRLLDPKELNKAIRHEHYPLPTIEEIATRLHGAKYFTVLDARNGFWHVGLDRPSSLLTTFNTPFGSKYSLRLKYKKCPEMYLADTLSGAYLPEVNVCESIQKLEEVDHTSTLAVPADRIERLKDRTYCDSPF